MGRTIKILETIDKQTLKDQDEWNDRLEGSWPFISFFIGKAFDLPV